MYQCHEIHLRVVKRTNAPLDKLQLVAQKVCDELKLQFGTTIDIEVGPIVRMPPEYGPSGVVIH